MCGSNGSHRRHRPRTSADGFLFHDSENDISVNDIRKALHTLSETCEGRDERPRVNTAYVVQLNERTLAASFSLRGVPHPEEASYWDLQKGVTDLHAKTPLRGWFIDKLDDLSSAPVRWEYNAIYDACILLERATGACPCPKATDGSCRNTILRSALPKAMQTDDVFDGIYRLEPEAFKRVRYKTLPGDWVFTSSKATTHDDFARTLRPWDDYDFSLSSDRKTTLKARGVARHVREKFRENKCTVCEFAVTTYKGAIKDCGYVRGCSEPTDAIEANGAIEAWLDASGFMKMEGFSDRERDYLIRAAGIQYFSSALGGQRRMHTILAGFHRKHGGLQGPWIYKVAAAKGGLARYTNFTSYEELRTRIPELPAPTAIPDIDPISRRAYYALACIGSQGRRYYAYHGQLPVRKVELTETRVNWDVATGRYVLHSDVFHLDASLARAIEINPELTYTGVAQYYRQSLALKQVAHKRKLPVMT